MPRKNLDPLTRRLRALKARTEPPEAIEYAAVFEDEDGTLVPFDEHSRRVLANADPERIDYYRADLPDDDEAEP